MLFSHNRVLLGAHMSIVGGFHKALERGASINCATIQIFTKSNRQWGAKLITKKDIELFLDMQKVTGIKPVIAHATYLINVGSPKKDVEIKSVNALRIELQRCELLQIPYLVLHPGSHLNTDEHSCLEKIAHNITSVLKETPGNTKILLETMAGQGSNVCYTFEQIAYIIQNVNPKSRIGVCFDTCHVFAAGYDFTTPQRYKAMWEQFDSLIGRKYLSCIHFNDSKKECGSRVDRHADIGKGTIGLAGFKLFMNDPTLFDIPKILETPKETPDDDARNMEVLMNLITKSR